MGQIKFISSLLFILLFTISVVSYSIDFGTDNNASVRLSNDSDFVNLNSNIQSNFNTYRENINDSSTSFFRSSIKKTEETITTGNSFNGGVSTLLTSLKLIFSTGKTKIFGGNNSFGIYFTVFSAFLAFVGLVYLFKTWKGGNPD